MEKRTLVVPKKRVSFSSEDETNFFEIPEKKSVHSAKEIEDRKMRKQERKIKRSLRKAIDRRRLNDSCSSSECSVQSLGSQPSPSGKKKLRVRVRNNVVQWELC